MDKALGKIMDIVCDELEEIANKGTLSAGDLDAVYKMVVTKEKILRTEEIEQDLGYSQDGDWRASGTYGNGHSYGRHYVRGHYSRIGYSMAEAKDDIRGRIQSMMDDPNISSADRQSLQRAMDMIR